MTEDTICLFENRKSIEAKDNNSIKNMRDKFREAKLY